MWEPEIHYLGTLKEKSKNIFSFIYKGELPLILYPETIQAGCSCTKVTWFVNEKRLEATYIPIPIPQHLLDIGQQWYNGNRIISFEYSINGGITKTTKTLQFHSKIVK